ncbi:hypothetical protein [Sphingomonas sp.]|uniref:hypothetical protein n=1 Tax=Sphingomonas sp. TaxID=28214 RepID=UPI0028AC7914|nr:hypothetical protein [Sphingomonas sp.]
MQSFAVGHTVGAVCGDRGDPRRVAGRAHPHPLDHPFDYLAAAMRVVESARPQQVEMAATQGGHPGQTLCVRHIGVSRRP